MKKLNLKPKSSTLKTISSMELGEYGIIENCDDTDLFNNYFIIRYPKGALLMNDNECYWSDENSRYKIRPLNPGESFTFNGD